MASLLSGIDKVFNTLPTKFIWEYQNSSNTTFEKFDRGATRKLEQAFKTNGTSGSLDVKMKGKTYSCTFSSMEWKDPTKSGYYNKAKPIRRNAHVSTGLQELIHLEDTKEAYLKQKRNTIGLLFDEFKDEDEDDNLDIVRFSEALDIDLAQLEILLICYYCHAKLFPYITKDEFVQGLGRMECDSIQSIKTKLPALMSNLTYTTVTVDKKQQPSPFMTTLFKYLYLLFKTQVAENTKRLPMKIIHVDEDDGEETIAFDLLLIMDLLYEGKWSLYNEFKTFIQQCMAKDCPAYRMQQFTSYGEDEWNMTLKFACSYPSTCDAYESGAWPNLFDCFGELYWQQNKSSGTGETKQ